LNTTNRLPRITLVFLVSLIAPVAHAEEDFATWLAAFEREALAHGISQATLDATFRDTQPVPRAVELDHQQPEFIQTFSAYLQQRVTPRKITGGKTQLRKHRTLLRKVESRYGVPRSILVALWGMETNYGDTLGNFSVPSTLATLAHEGRRRDFFRSQLLDAMRILESGHVTPQAMKGSWAGAMGHMQFMPSTVLAYALDGNGDGHIDLRQSLSDALHSAGNYLHQAGWRSGEPAVIEVRLPESFDWQQAQLNYRLPVSDWALAGVKPVVGVHGLPSVTGPAAIVLPQGWRGPAFMVFDNFDVLMQWNRSVNYAIATAHLADRIIGGAAYAGGLSAENEALSQLQMLELQQQLTSMGFEPGEADGMPGLRTQSAIRLYQQTHGLPMDGYASSRLLEHVRANSQPPSAE
jgi:membrane-bound lytic murein transglycosylase B